MTSGTTGKQGVLLLNLGSPDSTATADVRRYLREFLSDPRVIDIPAPVRAAILNLFILPFRPRKSAEAYRTIWTPEGSPLIISTYKIADALAERIALPVAVGMRYGNPSTASAVKKLIAQGVTDLFVIPLYPHYAMSSYETAAVRALEAADALRSAHPDLTVTVQPPFFDDPDYIDALAAVVQENLPEGVDTLADLDHVLFSYHGVPERQVRKTDPTGSHCLTGGDCCERSNPEAQQFCYRHQCFITTKRLATQLGIPNNQYSVAFQSRLGRDPWLQPFTDATLEKLPSMGKKHIAVLCPAFISDCLETLEEIAIEGRHEFLEAGGKSFTYIPCLNEHPRWIDVLERFVTDFQDGQVTTAAIADTQ